MYRVSAKAFKYLTEQAKIGNLKFEVIEKLTNEGDYPLSGPEVALMLRVDPSRVRQMSKELGLDHVLLVGNKKFYKVSVFEYFKSKKKLTIR